MRFIDYFCISWIFFEKSNILARNNLQYPKSNEKNYP